MKKKICIVAGEPESINTEIIAKSWKKLSNNLKKKIFVIGNFNLINDQFNGIGIKIKTNKINSISDKFDSKKINIFNINLNYKKPFKINIKKKSKYISKCLNLAHNLCIEKKLIGFINCSIDKNIFKNYDGVTEFLAKKNKLNNTQNMLIYGKEFSVVPITTHQNLKNALKKVNKQLLMKKIFSLSADYKKLFRNKPKIAVLGLNPHNSEFRNSSEETKIIKPCVNSLIKKKVKIYGPFSSDQMFLNKMYKKFDVIVGMYHDQVLTPLKIISGFNAINITLGLKYIRVSPDHGTAKNLIKKNLSNYKSLLNAIFFLNSKI